MTASAFLRRADWLGRDRIQAYSRITALALIPSLWIYCRRARTGASLVCASFTPRRWPAGRWPNLWAAILLRWPSPAFCGPWRTATAAPITRAAGSVWRY